jgi:ABC-type dipeptide/oligopeptide/nickel transport system ATPase component
MLDANQAKVKMLIEKGYSVYITGKGGCGKSFFITSIMDELRAKDICCFVTAPTGKAANRNQAFCVGYPKSC